MSACAERRREARHERGDLDMTLLIDGREVPSSDHSLLDISRHGLGLHVQRGLYVGQAVEFRLSLPTGSVSGRGAVRWVSESGGGCRCGVSTSPSGFLGGFRLDRFLEPGTAAGTDAVDRLLLAAALGVLALCGARAAGWDVASIGEIWRFYLG